jgi:hypothetical protein
MAARIVATGPTSVLGIGKPDYTTQLAQSKNVVLAVAKDSVLPNGITLLADCASIFLQTLTSLIFTVTVKALVQAYASQGIRVHLRTSVDNINWDTVDYDYWDVDFTYSTVDQVIQQTKTYDMTPIYAKLLVENLDSTYAIIGVTANVVTG